MSKSVFLGEILDVQNGFAFDSKNFSTSAPIGLIRIRDLRNGTVTETGYAGSYDPAYLVHAGDFLIGMDGEFRCYMWKGAPALLNQRVCRLHKFRRDVDPRYVFYGINAHLERIEAETGYTTVKHLSSRTIKEIEFYLPPLAEQQRIVAKLDEVDAGLRTLSERLDVEQLRSAQVRFSVMNEVFLQRPGRETQEGSLVSSNWKWMTLGEVVSIEIGRTPSRSDPTMWDPARQSGAVWVSIADLTACEGRVISDSKEYISSLATVAGKPVRAGTLMMSFKLSIGKLAFAGTDLYTNEAIAALTVKHPERLSPDFLFQYLSHVDWVSLSAGNEKVKGATLNKAKLAVVPVPVPPLAEQERIVCKLEELQSACTEVSANIERRKAKAGELRQSVLAAAFRGDL